MIYTNEKCSVCNKAFADDDDIVVCPICGTPHHRQCYVDNKTCANESLHSQGFEWTPSDTEKAEISVASAEPEKQDDGHKVVFCPNCGKENPAEEPVCTNCGARLYNNQQKGVLSQPIILPDMSNQQFSTPVIQILPDDEIGGNKVSDTAEYIQLNADRYIPKMFKMEKTGNNISWNWAAFFFTPYWFFFRKLQITGFVLMLLSLIVTGCCATDRLVAATINAQDVYQQYKSGNATEEQLLASRDQVAKLPEAIVLSSSQLVLKIFAGLFANYLYKKKAEKDIRDIKSKATTPEAYRLMLFKRGGMSGTMCLLSFAGYFCALQILLSLITK